MCEFHLTHIVTLNCRVKVLPIREEPVTYSETDPLLVDKEKEKRTQKKQKRPSLVKVLLKMFACNFLKAIVFKVIQDCLIFVQPQLLRYVVKMNSIDKDIYFKS